MREAAEYVDGIFHESIMAIQSGTPRARGGRRGFVVSTPAEPPGCGLSELLSAPSRMFSIHSAGILGVFFPFPGSWIEWSMNKWLGREAANGIGKFVEPSPE